MKIVWLVRRYEPEGCAAVISVHSTEEGAEKAIERYLQDAYSCYEAFYTDSFEVKD